MKVIKEGQPPNYDQLKNDANNKTSWRIRLDAVTELSEWKCRQSIDILWRRIMSDDVYKIQHASFLGLQAFGEKVKLPKKKTGNILSGINKQLASINNSLPVGHSYIDFKHEFLKKCPVEYDTYEGEKDAKFDSWLENVWKSLPRK